MWYGDGTEIPTDEGKLHLVSVMEPASRRILGFTLSEHHDAAAAYGALAMAITARSGQVPGVIMHTDQGRNIPPGPSRPPASRFPSPSRWWALGIRLHIHMAAPQAIALMLGHHWNLTPPTTVYEHHSPGYFPAIHVS
jgi:hypothetical protein